jgi:hypothetical protein
MQFIIILNKDNLSNDKNKILNLPILLFTMRKLTPLKALVFLVFTLLYSNFAVAQSEGTIDVQSNEKVKQLIAKKRAYNKKLNYINGYKIQLFYGSEEGAIKLREKFHSVFPDIPSEIQFNSPDWKVWVGSYKTKLEVARALAEIKEGFPSAIRIAAKVKI